MPRVTLFPAEAAEGEAGPRLEIELPLEPDGRPASPGPHRAELRDASGAVQPGECVSEPGGEPFLRFPAGPDTPLYGVLAAEARFRPGDVVTLRRGNGAEEAWRVVGVA